MLFLFVLRFTNEKNTNTLMLNNYVYDFKGVVCMDPKLYTSALQLKLPDNPNVLELQSTWTNMAYNSSHLNAPLIKNLSTLDS